MTGPTDRLVAEYRVTTLRATVLAALLCVACVVALAVAVFA